MDYKEIKQMLDAHKKYLEGKPDGKRAVFLLYSLRGADFSGADLRDADLAFSDFSGANFCGADLRGAYMRGASLMEPISEGQI